MAYEKTNWQDTFKDAQGNVTQEGTPLTASRLNKMEDGIAGSASKEELGEVTAQLADIAINVKDFGAAGDGLTDDTSSIQSAINHAQQSSNARKVFLPKGKYLLSNTLKILVSDITIEGESATTTILYMPDKTSTTYKSFIQVGELSTDKTAQNITLKNFGIHSDSKHSWTYGINVSQGENVLISNINVFDMSFPLKFSTNTKSRNVTVENSTFTRCYEAIYSNVEYTKVLGCIGVDIGTVNKIDNLASTTGHGPFMYLGTTDNAQPLKGFVVQGCIVKGCHNAGIKASGCELSASDNHFDDVQHGVVSTNGSVLILSGNHVSNAKKTLFEAPFKISDSKVIIKNNVITDTNSNGIYLLRCKDSIISGNLITNTITNPNTLDLIIVHGLCDNIVIDGNIIKETLTSGASNQYGINIKKEGVDTPTNIKILNNILDNACASTGILSYAEKIEINGNTFKTTDSSSYYKTSAISIIGNNTTVKDNKFYVSSGKNVFLSSTPSENTMVIMNNEFEVVNTFFNYELNKGKKTRKGTSAPTSGTWNIGDETINTTPTAGGYMGFTCVTAGTPGTWKGYGLIQA